jgi:ABC-type oligopeptide transport system substrate-binding subunit
MRGAVWAGNRPAGLQDSARRAACSDRLRRGRLHRLAFARPATASAATAASLQSDSNALSSEDREFDELWKRSMDAIGIRIEFIKQKWPDLLKMSRAGQLQMFRLARFTILRDGGGLLEILYSKNIGTGMNDSHFNLPEFDRLFEQSRVLPDGAERNALYARMSEITSAYMPLMLGTYRYRTVLAQPWLLGLRPDPFFREPWKYLDIDIERRKKAAH